MGDVIDIFSKKILKDNSAVAKNNPVDEPKSHFEKQTQRNKANQERLRKEREQANKNVIKSYRIK
ncbi:hypothetical protein QEJ31_11985 [Pigmentibacter sp. JX0631]|uniref:hypothetical protein n=1 Tax=Pigmentibacter sp. JX0631 TaxID=2976982 RepID=UPI002468DA43|nr:hypothetical protein [Pigmentibacter sp. JX0631]WGL59242.1 hypothetical protein QEJ31_11985 [Pigmentibacter sp. JX0631]